MAAGHSNVSVHVVEFKDRKHYQMQYRDPVTGRKVTRSTGVERTGTEKARRAAEKAAGQWQRELLEGPYCPPSKIKWAHFRERYENEVLSSLAAGTQVKVDGVFNLVERIINPERLQSVNAERLSHFQSKLREEGRAESTIADYLAHLKAALRWAARMGMIHKAPEIQRPKRAKAANTMKGRPITLEEFERMLAKVPTVVDKADVARWKFYLNGLWTSGLRLSESLGLTWDGDGSIRVDLSGKYPVLVVPAELEKGNKDRLLPMAPEFAELLATVDADKRTGFVFDLSGTRGKRLDRYGLMHIIGQIGRRAGVKVATKERDGKEVVKYATAHDLRRSYGERWASRVMPQVLKELMRHESIETTLRFYVGRNAQTTAAVLWQAHKAAVATTSELSGNTSGNSGQSSDAVKCSK